jgi:hypothetical protein
MRVLIIDTVYPGFVAEHYAHRPELARMSYDAQWRALMDRFFGTGDAYSHYLAALGHDAHEVVINASQLQRRWAVEHGVRRRPWKRRDDLVVAQAAAFEPDVVYVQDLWALSDRTLDELGRGRLLAGQIASESPPDDRLRRFDVIFTSFPHYVERFRALGVASEYLRIGFDPRALDRLGDDVGSGGAVFVGSLGRSQHDRGNAVLESAARRTPIEFWGRGADEWAPSSPIRTGYRGEAWGLDALRVLARSRIALNRHIDVAEGHANNMRLYEATGVGTMLLTDEGSNLSDLFEVGTEVATYTNADELAEKAAYYLAHEGERASIAAAGHARTLRDHTYATRMAELAAMLERAR